MDMDMDMNMNMDTNMNMIMEIEYCPLNLSPHQGGKIPYPG